MSKSLNNFLTLDDVEKKGFSPLAFRLLVLQSEARSQANFNWEIMQAAQNRYDKLEGPNQEGELTPAQQEILNKREDARQNKDWEEADRLRKELEKQGIGLNDTNSGPVWYRV